MPFFAPLPETDLAVFAFHRKDEKRGIPTTTALHWVGSIHFYFYLLCSCQPSLGQIESDYAAPIAFSGDLASRRLVRNSTSVVRIYKAGDRRAPRLPPSTLTPLIFSVLLLTWVSLIDTPACLSPLNPMHF